MVGKQKTKEKTKQPYVPLTMTYTYSYPRPAMTADCVVLAKNEGHPRVLLVQRASPPFKGRWALPGGFMNMDELLIDTARRELEEETGLKAEKLTFIGMYDEPGRDPRGRTISAAYLVVPEDEVRGLQAGSDAGKIKWFELHNIPPLAFDHDKILQDAVKCLEKHGEVRGEE